MATYEFQCAEGHITEHKMPMTSEQQVIPCGSCEGQAQRIISLSTFQFKCSGFHATDYVHRESKAGTED